MEEKQVITRKDVHMSENFHLNTIQPKVEAGRYQKWLDADVSSLQEIKKLSLIQSLIPQPNCDCLGHAGHNSSRYHYLSKTCKVLIRFGSGMDHAKGIATQLRLRSACVVKAFPVELGNREVPRESLGMERRICHYHQEQ